MKRRPREINIFNMSLLDILCGALGAFCFMMLALFPFYRPSAPPAGAAEPADVRQLEQEAEKLERELEQVRARRDDRAAADLAKENEVLRRELRAVQHDLAKQPTPPGRTGGVRAADIAVKVTSVKSDACEFEGSMDGPKGGKGTIMTIGGSTPRAVLLHLIPGTYTLYYEYTRGPTCTVTGTFLSTMGDRGPIPQVRLTQLGKAHVVARFSVTADGRIRVK